MKRIFALILVCATALPFSGCQKTENNGNFKRSEPISAEIGDIADTVGLSAVESFAPEQQPEPVFIDDIHEWEEDNVLYNINNTYELTDRYYLQFARTEAGVLWYGAKNVPAINEKYRPDEAVEFARAHWDDDLDVCAPFISRCLKAGGLSIGSDSSTALCLMLVNSRLGFGQFLPMNDDFTVTLPEYARPGDVVQLFCSYEGLMIHSLMFVGNDENGLMKVCCHNSKNSGTYAFRSQELCNSCLTPLKEVFYFHFYGEGEERPEAALGDNDTLLFENTGYAVPGQHYDRAEAAECAKRDPIDGIGQFGAERTSAALSAGGINVSTPIQSALFMQLMKSRHGSMHSIPVNPDRTVTLPEFAREGDVCFLYCPTEAMFYSSFIIKGTDADGKMIGYSRDKINNENSAFKVESVCPSSICDAKIKEAVIYHFED